MHDGRPANSLEDGLNLGGSDEEAEEWGSRESLKRASRRGKGNKKGKGIMHRKSQKR